MKTVSTAIFRGVIWAAALLFGLGFWLGPVLGAGAALGGVVSVLTEGRRVSPGARRTFSVQLLVQVCAVMLLPVLPPLLALAVPAAVSAVPVNLQLGFIAGFLCAALTSFAARRSGVAPLEPLFASLIASIPFFDSRGGHFLRPRWFSDAILSMGWDPAFLLSCAGGGIILAASAVLILSSRRNGTHGPAIRSASIVIVMLSAAAAVWLLTRFLPPVPPAPVPPPKPPMSFAGDPPPPPPPQPEPVAAVQFSDVLRPSSRLRGFFFRRVDAASPSGTMPVEGRVIRSTIWYLKPGSPSLELPGHALTMPVEPGSVRAKGASWSAVRIQTVSNREDFVIGPDDDAETVLSSTEAVQIRTNAPSAITPGELRFLADMDEAVAGKGVLPEKGVLRTLVAGGRAHPCSPTSILQPFLIAEWVASHACLDDAAGNTPRTPDELLRAGMKGKSAEFARLTAELLKARGIECRIAEGYFVPAEGQSDDRLIITDSESSVWPEVRSAGGAWIPLPVRPWKISSHDQPPPPEEDRKKEIFEALARDCHKPRVETPRTVHVRSLQINPAAKMLLLLAAILLSALVIVLLLRVLLIIGAASPKIRPRILLAWMGNATTKRTPRSFGKSWERYAAEDLMRRNLHRGILMMQILPACDLDHPRPMGTSGCVATLVRFLIWGAVPNFLQFTLRKPSASHPLVTP